METLEKARAELSILVDKEFEAAAAEENEDKVEKYLRLFPLLKEPAKES